MAGAGANNMNVCTICRGARLRASNFVSSKYGIRKILICQACGHHMDTTTYETSKSRDVEQGGLPSYRLREKDALDAFVKGKQRFLHGVINRLRACGLQKQLSDIRFVDFGCGGGEVVLAGHTLFQTSRGVNLDLEYYKWNRNLLGLTDEHTAGLVVDSIDKLTRSYDVVISWHVLEHFEDPKAFIEAIRMLCTQYVFVQVPSLVDNGIAPNHYSYFSPQSIQRLFESNGFTTLQCYHDHKTRHLNYVGSVPS